MAKKTYPVTPDGRYFFAKNRLWRCTDPNLSESDRRSYVKRLMRARLAVKHASTDEELVTARQGVQKAKELLGERGPVWWDDGAPDISQYHPKNTVYANWWRNVSDK